jgi:electron transfer flavoprotein alpha subunit/quercetin dioxygenase-like cupin family protein
MKRDLNIWVFGDHRHSFQIRLTRQVIGLARSLCKEQGRVTVIALGYELEGAVRELIGYGADRVLIVDHKELAVYRIDLFTSLISDLIREHSPELFLAGATEFGVELASRVSKRLGVGLSAECVGLTWDKEEGRLIALSPAFGGQYLARTGWSRDLPCMATISSGAFPECPYDPAAQGEIVKVERSLDQYSSRINVISSVYEPHQTAGLEEARVVVSGGRGVKTLPGFNYIRELASLIGGEVGATRPAIDAHWTSHEHLIGQTGKAIRPELLITCGTSGAVQYTAGIRGARTIVAVNRDAHAPIFKMADIGVIADTQSFLPTLISEVKAHLFKEITELYRAQVKPGNDRKPVTFGQRIRRLREDHKMTVTDLAEKTGQPPEFIEQVESDLVTPPVSFLLQLSRALQIDPSHFLTEQEKTQIDEKRQEGFIKRTQNYSYRTLTPGAANKHLRAFMVTIEPREAHKMIEYKHPGEEFIFVYRGELELTLGGKVLNLKQGENIHFDSETKHKLRNTSDARCELLVTLYTP